MRPDVKAVWSAGKVPILVVCFSGNHENLAWEKRLRRLNVHFLHLQDSRGRWYIEGADGSAGFWDTIYRIKNFRAALPGYPLITLGQSSGGYAALRIGATLNADSIIAFAPQTRFLVPRRIFEDQFSLGVPGDIPDIRDAINSATGRINIVVARSEAKNPPSQFFFDDHAHLEGIFARPNVRVVVNSSDSHAVARDMADLGLLDELISNEISYILATRSTLSRVLSALPNWCLGMLPARRPSKRAWA